MNDFNLAIIIFCVFIISFIIWKLGEKSSSIFKTNYILGDQWNNKIMVFRNKQNTKDTLNDEGITSLCTDIRRCQNRRCVDIVDGLSEDDKIVHSLIYKYVQKASLFANKKDMDITWLRMNNENFLAADEFEILDDIFEFCSSCYVNYTKRPMSIEMMSSNMGVQKLCIVVKGSLNLSVEDHGDVKSKIFVKGDSFSWDNTYRTKINTLEESVYILFDVPRTLGSFEKINLELINKDMGHLENFKEDLNNLYILDTYGIY